MWKWLYRYDIVHVLQIEYLCIRVPFLMDNLLIGQCTCDACRIGNLFKNINDHADL